MDELDDYHSSEDEDYKLPSDEEEDFGGPDDDDLNNHEKRIGGLV